MALDPLAIALQGLGYGALQAAAQGLLAEQEIDEPPASRGAGAFGIGGGRRRRRYDEDEDEALLLMRLI